MGEKLVKIKYGEDNNESLTFKELYDLMTEEIENYKIFDGGKHYENLLNSKIEFHINDDDSLLIGAKCVDVIGLLKGGEQTVITGCIENIMWENY